MAWKNRSHANMQLNKQIDCHVTNRFKLSGCCVHKFAYRILLRLNRAVVCGNVWPCECPDRFDVIWLASKLLKPRSMIVFSTPVYVAWKGVSTSLARVFGCRERLRTLWPRLLSCSPWDPNRFRALWGGGFAPYGGRIIPVKIRIFRAWGNPFMEKT